jgi:hypothetical protein
MTERSGAMKKSLKKLTLNRETVKLIDVAAGLRTLAAGCVTGVGGGCGPTSPPETCRT